MQYDATVWDLARIFGNRRGSSGGTATRTNRLIGGEGYRGADPPSPRSPRGDGDTLELRSETAERLSGVGDKRRRPARGTASRNQDRLGTGAGGSGDQAT